MNYAAITSMEGGGSREAGQNCCSRRRSLVAVTFVSAPAYAWDWYTPHDGYTFADEDYYYLRGVWSSTSVDKYSWWDAWEGELRGTSQAISAYYSGLGSSWGGSFPGRYREYDSNDVMLGMASPHLMSANTTYYAYTYTTPSSGQPGSFSVLLESELCYDYGGLPDPVPRDWETITTFTIPGSASW